MKPFLETLFLKYCSLFFFCFFLLSGSVWGNYILIPMDENQKNHLKSYGVAYWILTKEVEIDWLLNYKGGSFLCKYHQDIEKECKLRGITYQVLADGQTANILQEIADPDVNMDAVKLHKAPKIVVYSPKSKLPWDDAVTLVLTYAEIPYDILYDSEILEGALPLYDWLHLHHEDFTGQYGKFWAAHRNNEWYKEDVAMQEATAKKYGFTKVSQLKLAVAKKMRDFVMGGGFMFAMCSAPDSYDVALSAEGVDICREMFDGDPIQPNCQQVIDYNKTFAFTNYTLNIDPYAYEISSIDVTDTRPQNLTEKNDFFTLFDFSAKWDWIPTMLTQNHERIIKGFMGQTTAFRKSQVKTSTIILGENKSLGEVRYLHGTFEKGTWTFLGGHDPEDYRHFVGDPPTNLELYPNSPGYRLILNNILFPAAKKEKQKT